MSQSELAAEIVRRAKEVRQSECRLTPEQVEALLRPLVYQITFETKTLVQHLLSLDPLRYDLDCWIEANLAVNGQGPAERIDHLRRFLADDRCECVLQHLPAAIAHFHGPIHEKVAETLRRGPGVG